VGRRIQLRISPIADCAVYSVFTKRSPIMLARPVALRLTCADPQPLERDQVAKRLWYRGPPSVSVLAYRPPREGTKCRLIMLAILSHQKRGSTLRMSCANGG